MKAFFSSRTFLVSAGVTGTVVYLAFAHTIGNLVGKIILLVCIGGLVWLLSKWTWLNPTLWIRWVIGVVIGLLVLGLFLATNSFEKFGKLSEGIVAFPADVLWQVLSCAFQAGIVVLICAGIVWAIRNRP